MRWTRENDFDADINTASLRYGVPVALIKAVVGVEAGFNPMAINYSDPGYAWGLMQMIPATAKALGYSGSMEDLLTDTATAINLGAKLLGQNLARSGQVVADSISAYNGGYRPSLGFGATLPTGSYGNQTYVNSVLAAYAYFRGSEVGSPAGGAMPAGAPSFPDRAGGRLDHVGPVAARSPGSLRRLMAWFRRVMGL
jgi:soluble lytic murein transglycosylase-like protein